MTRHGDTGKRYRKTRLNRPRCQHGRIRDLSATEQEAMWAYASQCLDYGQFIERDQKDASE